MSRTDIAPFGEAPDDFVLLGGGQVLEADAVASTEPGNWAPRQLVYAADVLRALAGTSSEAAALAAEQASAC